MKKIISLFLITLLLFINGCSEKPLARLTNDSIEIDMAGEFDPRSIFSDIQDGVEITYEIDEENSTVSFLLQKGDKQEEYKDIKATLIYPEEVLDPLVAPYKAKALEDIEIHDDHSSDSNLAGYTRAGDTFEVYEIYQAGEETWCRISSKHWINNKSLSLLDLLPYDTNINYIKDVITFTDEALSSDRLSPWYDRYYQYVPCTIESRCDYGKCELDEKGRVVKWTDDWKNSYGDFSWIEYTYDDMGRRIHVSSS
ncbi:MAG: hypothetical protein IKE38_01570, partial [Erysipelotrichaceae bacterium]|nr:hypothetical protein [Erysipelotrichaceae bacterium]